MATKVVSLMGRAQALSKGWGRCGPLDQVEFPGRRTSLVLSEYQPPSRNTWPEGIVTSEA